MKLFKHIQKEIKNHKVDYLLVLVLVILTAVVRFTPIVTGNFPFLFDHGRDLLDVNKIIVDHKPTLIGPFTGIQGVFQGPYHYYLLAIASIIGNGHPASGTVFMALLGVVGVIICYMFGKQIASRQFGIIAALFFAIAPASIAFSQHFWNPHWIPFLMILFYISLYKSIYGNKKYLVATWFFAGLMAQLEVADGLWMLPVLVVSYLILDRKAFLNKWFYIGGVVYGVLFLPQVLFDLRHQFLMTQSIVALFEGKNQSLGAVIPFNIRLSLRLDEVLRATVFALSNNQLIAYLFLISGVLYTAYTIVKKQTDHLRILILFLIAPVLYYSLFIFFPRPAWAWYWIGIQVSYYFFVAYSLSQIARLHIFLKASVFLFLILWAVITINSYHTFPVYDDQGTGIFKNEMNVINYLYKDAKGKPFSVFVYTPPVYDYAYQYLFWWAGTRMYNYVPGKSKDGLFYLIIEPDPERPLAPKGWKETVIKTGTVTWDKVFTGNITVEKRQGR